MPCPISSSKQLNTRLLLDRPLHGKAAVRCGTASVSRSNTRRADTTTNLFSDGPAASVAGHELRLR